MNFLSRLIQILERGEGRRERERERGEGREVEGRVGEKPFVTGGSDLAKLKSLLYYGRTGKIGYTPGGSRWNF